MRDSMNSHRHRSVRLFGDIPNIPKTIAKPVPQLLTDARANGQLSVDCECELTGHVKIETDRLGYVIIGDETRSRFEFDLASRSVEFSTSLKPKEPRTSESKVKICFSTLNIRSAKSSYLEDRPQII